MCGMSWAAQTQRHVMAEVAPQHASETSYDDRRNAVVQCSNLKASTRIRSQGSGSGSGGCSLLCTCKAIAKGRYISSPPSVTCVLAGIFMEVAHLDRHHNGTQNGFGRSSGGKQPRPDRRPAALINDPAAFKKCGHCQVRLLAFLVSFSSLPPPFSLLSSSAAAAAVQIAAFTVRPNPLA